MHRYAHKCSKTAAHSGVRLHTHTHMQARTCAQILSHVNANCGHNRVVVEVKFTPIRSSPVGLRRHIFIIKEKLGSTKAKI